MFVDHSVFFYSTTTEPPEAVKEEKKAQGDCYSLFSNST